jgi:hypothetical protein
VFVQLDGCVVVVVGGVVAVVVDSLVAVGMWLFKKCTKPGSFGRKMVVLGNIQVGWNGWYRQWLLLFPFYFVRCKSDSYPLEIGKI